MTVVEQQRSNFDRPWVDGWLASWNVETALYVLVGAAAFLLRFVQLGDPPLSAVEAREALSAWRLVSMSEITPVQPVSAAWYALTSLTFFLFGASETAARLWPMLAGWALVFAPALFRRELGRSAALAASAMLAISPVMLAASRTADGTTLAAVSLMLAAAGMRRFVERDSNVGIMVAGGALGLGLAAGPRFISAVAASGLALLLASFARPEAVHAFQTGWLKVQPRAWRLLAAAGVGFVVVASVGGVVPAGLSAGGAAVPRWIGGWALSADTRPIWLVPQLLVVHEPLLVILGIGGLYVAFASGLWHHLASRRRQVAAAREPDTAPDLTAGRNGLHETSWRATTAGLSAAALGALLFGILYVGREAADALWVVLPLAMLSGKVVVEVFAGDWFEGEAETVAAQAAVLFVMFVFVYFQLSAYGHGFVLLADRPLEIRLALAGGVIALAAFVTVMFALGWSKVSAIRGAVLALGAVTLLGTLGAGLGMALWRAGDPNDLWTPAAPTSHVPLMVDTLRAISNRAAGNERDVEIAVVSAPAVAARDGQLGWELRSFTDVRFVDSPGASANAAVVIADDFVQDPALGSAYVGETFPIQIRQVQAEPAPQTLVSWWLYRAWPTEVSRRVTVWVRADIHQLISQR